MPYESQTVVNLKRKTQSGETTCPWLMLRNGATETEF